MSRPDGRPLRRVLVRTAQFAAALLTVAALALAAALFRPGFTPGLKGERSVASLERIRLSGDDQA